MDTRAFINEHEIAPLKTVIETYLLNGYKTKPSIIKRKFWISWNIRHLQDIDPWARADYLRRFCRYTSVLRGEMKES